eukprot:GEMP01016483.1.p1 GENE.GEMP01016483.1~~GEMP01016483.1.p1  ORF type:complete len:593 (+),score=133.82 GEMP01016483.1:460-2238(+)
MGTPPNLKCGSIGWSRINSPSESEASSDLKSEASDPEENEEDKLVPVVAVDEEKISLAQMLSNIFDAADEDGLRSLTHKEVRDLLYSTPLGLEEWDVLLLLTNAVEQEDTGLIEYQAFVQIGPEIIEELHKRRLQYKARNMPVCFVTQEAAELCYGEEIEEVCRQMREVFFKAWQDGDKKEEGALHRTQYRQCLRQKPERFTPQEIQMVMQMLVEDDCGMIKIDDLGPQMVQLRIQALHNAMVETDVASLRVHLIILLRREGLQRDNMMPIWSLRNVLLRADQLCLTRMQVHVLLSITHQIADGWVDIEYALRVLCTVIPQFFDAQMFMDKAQQTAKEQQAAQELAELKELQGFQGKSMEQGHVEEEEDDQPDREAIEKALIHIGNLHMTDASRGISSMDVKRFLQAMQHEGVTQAGFLEHEIRGFIAEAAVDDDGMLPYQNHVHLWVPILFELRKHRLCESIINQDWSPTSPHLVDLSIYERTFALHPDSDPSDSPMMDRRSSQSKSRLSLRGSLQSSRAASLLLDRLRKSQGFVNVMGQTKSSRRASFSNISAIGSVSSPRRRASASSLRPTLCQDPSKKQDTIEAELAA